MTQNQSARDKSDMDCGISIRNAVVISRAKKPKDIKKPRPNGRGFVFTSPIFPGRASIAG